MGKIEVLTMFWLNPWSARGASHRSTIMGGNCPTIIHTFLALYSQWMMDDKEMRTSG